MNILLLTLFELFFARLDTAIFATDYTITISDKSGPLTMMGSVAMQGEKFVGSVLGMEAAYDGKTLYLYDPRSNELTLSAPKPWEMADTNPYLYIQDLIGDTPLDVKMDSVSGFPKSVSLKQDKQRIKLSLRHSRWLNKAPEWKVTKKGAKINDLR